MECIKCLMENKGAVCGQGFTEYTCEKCGEKSWHHNTNVPKYCSNCSEKYNICERCGGNLDERR